MIGAVYGSTSIIADNATAAATGAQPVYAIASNATVTSANLTVNQTNMGIESIHNFLFKLSVDTTASYMYCFVLIGHIMLTSETAGRSRKHH